jgi:hypothetical protein
MTFRHIAIGALVGAGVFVTVATRAQEQPRPAAGLRRIADPA